MFPQPPTTPVANSYPARHWVAVGWGVVVVVVVVVVAKAGSLQAHSLQW